MHLLVLVPCEFIPEGPRTDLALELTRNARITEASGRIALYLKIFSPIPKQNEEIISNECAVRRA